MWYDWCFSNRKKISDKSNFGNMFIFFLVFSCSDKFTDGISIDFHQSFLFNQIFFLCKKEFFVHLSFLSFSSKPLCRISLLRRIVLVKNLFSFVSTENTHKRKNSFIFLTLTNIFLAYCVKYRMLFSKYLM
jgi:hypothetical protein